MYGINWKKYKITFLKNKIWVIIRDHLKINKLFDFTCGFLKDYNEDKKLLKNHYVCLND